MVQTNDHDTGLACALRRFALNGTGLPHLLARLPFPVRAEQAADPISRPDLLEHAPFRRVNARRSVPCGDAQTDSLGYLPVRCPSAASKRLRLDKKADHDQRDGEHERNERRHGRARHCKHSNRPSEHKL
jgi:hypothetical protein